MDYNKISSLTKSSGSTPNGPVRPYLVSNMKNIHHTIKCASDVELTDDEITAMNIVFSAIDAYVGEYGCEAMRPFNQATILMIHSDSFTVTSEVTKIGDSTAVLNGAVYRFVVCFIHRWRAQKLSLIHMAAILAEELCHYAFDIYDENEVKQKVADLLRYVGIACSVEELFPIYA